MIYALAVGGRLRHVAESEIERVRQSGFRPKPKFRPKSPDFRPKLWGRVHDSHPSWWVLQQAKVLLWVVPDTKVVPK